VRALTGAFFAAGADQVAFSLWKPRDRATSILIESFYRNLLRKDTGAAAALSEAKRRMLKRRETRSPHLWAPIVVLEGEARQ
jgi:CHAT domain-containing protein